MMMQKSNGAAWEVVMPGLVPGTHVLRPVWQGVDGRDKPGHDGVEALVRAICDGLAPTGRGRRPRA
ncbi:hypothetical protein ABID59_003539 [Bradyrhizobium sp. S3.3.6]